MTNVVVTFPFSQKSNFAPEKIGSGLRIIGNRKHVNIIPDAIRGVNQGEDESGKNVGATSLQSDARLLQFFPRFNGHWCLTFYAHSLEHDTPRRGGAAAVEADCIRQRRSF
jgi:hypothetical protein